MKYSHARALVKDFSAVQPGKPGLMNYAVQQLQEKGIYVENLYQELEMESLYLDTHEDFSYSGDQVQLHSHTFYEILYCEGGSVQYLLGAERYRVQHGDIVVIPPGVKHRPLLPPNMEQPYHRYVLWLNVEFAQRLYHELAVALPAAQGGPRMVRTAGTRWECIGDYFRHTNQERKQQAPGWKASIYGCSLQLLVQLARAASALQDITPLPEQRELLDDVIGYIGGNMAEKITLEGTARRFLVSESTLSHLFRKKLNVSFYRYVTQCRLLTAKTLITDGLSLEETRAQVGFADYSTFYRAFKREYGMSPQQFRQCQPLTEHPATAQ